MFADLRRFHEVQSAAEAALKRCATAVWSSAAADRSWSIVWPPNFIGTFDRFLHRFLATLVASTSVDGSAQRFTVKDPHDHLWYCGELLNAYRDRGCSSWMVDELGRVVDELTRLVGSPAPTG